MKKHTDIFKRGVFACAFLACAASLGLAPAQADFPGVHPAYRHALGALRVARRLLNVNSNKRGVDNQEDQALDAINAAITEIKAAGIDDGKPMQDSQPLDPNLINDHLGRLHQALRALRDARGNAHTEEVNTAALGLRYHAERDINSAIRHVRRAIKDNAR